MGRQTTLQLHTVPETRSGEKVLFSLLPPLALYAALAAVLAALLGLGAEWAAFLPGGAAVCACALLPKQRARILRGAVFLGTVLVPALLPAARDGLPLLAERLFAASEAVNAYAYRHFSLTGDPGPAALPWALILLGALLGLLCSLWSHRLCLLLLFLGTAFLEAHFGITPGIGLNLTLFILLALLPVLRPGNGRGEAVLLAGIGAVLAAVLLLAPGPIGRVETWSEQLRDELGAAAQGLEPQAAQAESEEERAHPESRQREESVRGDEQEEGSLREFEKRQETEREISLPHRTDWLRTVLLLLLTAALLIGPFLLFLPAARAKRRREERQAAFSVPSNEAAVRAMFAHILDWLRESGLKTENRPFSRYQAQVEALTDPEYAARYGEAVQIWQEAVYSDHPLTDAQRQRVKELLDTTAAALYARADRRTRFRMKYIRCLWGS